MSTQLFTLIYTNIHIGQLEIQAYLLNNQFYLHELSVLGFVLNKTDSKPMNKLCLLSCYQLRAELSTH